MTINIATGFTQNSVSQYVQVPAGQYMLAVGGTFGGATVTVVANIGGVQGVPIKDASYTEPAAEIITLPACTLALSVTGGFEASVSAALSEVVAKANLT